MSIALSMDAIAEKEPLVGNRTPLSCVSDDDMLASDHDAIDTEDSTLHEEEEEYEETSSTKRRMYLMVQCVQPGVFSHATQQGLT